jgi:hypothetical protein
MHRGLPCIESRLVKVLGLSVLRRHLEFRLRVHVTYRRNEPYMSEGYYGAMHGMQGVVCYMLMHNLTILTLTSHLLIYS